MVTVQCSRDNCTGDRLKIAVREGVEVDYCTTCRGVWLDRGELDKIIERAALSAPAVEDDDADITGKRRQPQRTSAYREDDDYRREESYRREEPQKRKGSFLADLFDF